MSIHTWIIYFFCIYCLTIQNNDGSQKISGDALKDLYKSFVSEYPIVSIEDPFDQDDWEHYAKMTGEIGANVQIVGDDLLVTNPKVCRLHKTPPPSPPKNVFVLLGETGRIVLWLVAFCIVSTEGSEGNWFKSMQCSSAQGTLILLKNFFRESYHVLSYIYTSLLDTPETNRSTKLDLWLRVLKLSGCPRKPDGVSWPATEGLKLVFKCRWYQ